MLLGIHAGEKDVDALILIAGSVIAILYFLWVFFLAMMNLRRAHEADLLSPVAMVLGMPLLCIFYVLDALVNFTLFSLLVQDLPREWTVSSHINRLLRTGKPYQARIAYFICTHLLDAFDPSGAHCNHLARNCKTQYKPECETE